MEEILASIRRIIADDDPGRPTPKMAEPVPPPPAARRPEPVPPPPPPIAEVVPPPPAPLAEAAAADLDALLSQPIPPPPEERPVADMPAADVLDLTEAMTTVNPGSEPANGGFQTIDGRPDLMFDESAAPRGAAFGEALVSASTSAAVDSAFNTLAHTVLVQNARTLEDLVRDMLRPLLKTWLDNNLPGMVERLVRAEIERVTRGRV